MPPWQAAFYFFTAAVLALAQGFSQSVISVNSQQLQGFFSTTQAETLWFTAAYMAPNASLTIALIKLRGRFGLRRFAEISIVVFLASGLLSFAANDFWSHLAVRFLAGCAAAPMSSLAFLYMLDPLPQQRKMNVGLSAALTLMFMGSTLTRLISPELIELGSWRGLTVLEASMAAIGLAASGGRVAQLGTPHHAVDGVPVADLVVRDLSVVGVLSGVGHWEELVDLVVAGHVDLDAMVDRVVPLEDVRSAYERLADPLRVRPKVLLDFMAHPTTDLS
jgi:MFS family permease